jgi:hypothetical protein
VTEAHLRTCAGGQVRQQDARSRRKAPRLSRGATLGACRRRPRPAPCAAYGVSSLQLSLTTYRPGQTLPLVACWPRLAEQIKFIWSTMARRDGSLVQITSICSIFPGSGFTWFLLSCCNTLRGGKTYPTRHLHHNCRHRCIGTSYHSSTSENSFKAHSSE